MSVMQVVGSSRISNTAYLAVASIYWTLYITTSGFALGLDVQTAMILVTPPAGIAAFLWVLRIEESVISRFLLWFIPESPGGKFIRYHMGYTVINSQSWKESLNDWTPISKSLRSETERVLRSPHLKEEMETLYRLFWLLISIPAVVILLGIYLQSANVAFLGLFCIQ